MPSDKLKPKNKSKFSFFQEKQKHTVIHDKFDRMSFSDVYEQSERLKKTEKEIDFLTIHELLLDTFNTFYKYDPKFYDDTVIREDYLVNKEMLQKAMKTDEYQKLRVITKLDELNSAIATSTFIETVIKEIEKRDPEIQQKIENLKNLQNQRLQLQQKLHSLQLQQQAQIQDRAQGQGKSQAQIQQHQQLNQQIQQLQQQLNATNQQIQQATTSIKQSVGQIAVSKAVKKASEKTKEVNNAVQALGWGTDKGQIYRVPAEERFKIANALLRSSKLMRLARELGRMKRLMTTTRKQKVRRKSSEIYDISMGNDLARLIPSEIVKLTIPELKSDFMKRFAEKQLLQYSLRDRESKGKGDFIACVDLSGSMKGEREIWAKAVTLAVSEMAVKEKRKFAVIAFDSNVKKVWEFREPELQDIIDFAELGASGGTAYEPPLEKAIEISEKMKNADILFITDSDCKCQQEFAEKFREWRKKNEARVLSVLIGERDIYGTLEKLSDKVLEISDLFEGAKEIFSFY